MRPVLIDLALVERPSVDAQGRGNGVRCEVIFSFISEAAREAMAREPALRRRIEEATAEVWVRFAMCTWTATARRALARSLESELRSDWEWNDRFDFRVAPSLAG